MSGMLPNLCPFGALFLILEKFKTRRGQGEVNMVDGAFL
jgi:hypothetical protein